MMLRFTTILCAMATAAVAQNGSAPSNPFSDDARQTYALIKRSLLAAVDKMPATLLPV